MNRWLEKIAESPSTTPTKPTEPPFVGSVGTLPGAFEEKNETEVPATTSEWGAWIAECCPLLPEDRTHVARGLFRLHPRLQQRLAARYVETWYAAANNERNANKQGNAGRRAANLIITQLLKGNGYV